MENTEKSSTDTLVSTNGIPIIDFGGLGLHSTPSRQWLDTIAGKVREAFTTRGIFFLVNHGIAEERFRSANKIMEQFCALPDDVKGKYTITSPEDPQGYSPIGTERFGAEKKVEIKHSFNIQTFSRKIPSKEIPVFEEEIGSLADSFHKLTTIMLQAISLSIGLDPEVLPGLHQGMMKQDTLSTFRMMYYPPIDGEYPKDAIRCGAHKDWGTIVMLSQDIDGGLEVFLDNKWNRVGYLPGSIFVNLGEVLEKWSDFQYRAVLHRVVIPDDPELRSKGRHSVGIFVFADNNTSTDRSALVPSDTTKENVTKGQAPATCTVFQHVVNRLTEAYTGSNEL